MKTLILDVRSPAESMLGQVAVGLLSSCAWCGRVRIDGQWILAPPAALAAIDGRNTLSHSICDECARALAGHGTVAVAQLQDQLRVGRFDNQGYAPVPPGVQTLHSGQ